MRKVYGLVLLVQVSVWLGTLNSCKNETANTTKKTDANAKVLQYSFKEVKKKECVGEGRCAEFSVSYLVLVSSTNPAAAENIMDSLSSFLYNITNGDDDLPLDKALYASADAMIDDFKEFVSENDEGGEHGRSIEATSEVLVNNTKIVTIYIGSYEYLGGAHPNTNICLQSFNSQTGEAIALEQLVSDTSHLQAMLEPKYKEDKGLKADGDLKELLFEDFSRLPLPAHFGIVPKGIRFYYNDYEVASHAVGPADLLITWQELGALSDKNKWF